MSRAFDNFNLRERIQKSGKKWLKDIFFAKKSMGDTTTDIKENQRKFLTWINEVVEDYFEEHFGYSEETHSVFHINSDNICSSFGFYLGQTHCFLCVCKRLQMDIINISVELKQTSKHQR